MADPKYANLPGIAIDEPDVYESNDLPESDQTSDFYEEENESVEHIHISATEAFNKFKGKSLNANKVDFSERISKHSRTGYDARSGEWQLAGYGEPETLLQKYQRLQCEINEVLEEVNKVKNDEKEEVNCLITTEQVQQALKKLTDLRLEETLGAKLISSIADPQGAQIRCLLSQIEQFKLNVSEKPESETSVDDTSGITYQLNYRPEQARLEQTGRLTELEVRLRRLENILGATSEKLDRLASGTKKESLLETAEHLCATASLLDSAQLDHIEGRLSALMQNLDVAAEKQSKLADDPEKDKMINELYDMVISNEGIKKILPQTVERLAALEQLHKKAVEFNKMLTQIETMQSEIAGNIDNNKALLKGVQESFAFNLDEINKTVINLDARLKALKK